MATPPTPTPTVPAAIPVSLRYPGDLAEEHADWVSFEFFTYYGAFKATAAGVGDAGDFNGFLASYNEIALERAAGMSRIALYMPEDISANYEGKWGGRDFSPLGAAALRSAGQGINQAKDKGQIEQMVKTLGADLNSMKGGLLPYLAAAGIAGAMNGLPGFGGNVTTNDVLASTQGVILNPNTEVLYGGPQLRTFGLTFKLLPRNADESSIIRNICNTFKKAQLARASTRHGGNARNLIGVPNVVSVKFMHKNNQSKWITQFKHCALGGVDINYTPDGTWATYRTGAPVAITLGLQFTELKTLYSEEITDETNY